MTEFTRVFQPIPLRLNYRLISTIRYLQRVFIHKKITPARLACLCFFQSPPFGCLKIFGVPPQYLYPPLVILNEPSLIKNIKILVTEGCQKFLTLLLTWLNWRNLTCQIFIWKNYQQVLTSWKIWKDRHQRWTSWENFLRPLLSWVTWLCLVWVTTICLFYPQGTEGTILEL